MLSSNTHDIRHIFPQSPRQSRGLDGIKHILPNMPPSVFSTAPSYNYLYFNSPTSPHLSDNGKAFLSPETGFLPPKPLPNLPKPYEAWAVLAQRLPSYCKTNDWSNLVRQFPTQISIADLPDEHLIRANLCIGAIAHSIQNNGNERLPDSISFVWKQVSNRLGRTIPCLSAMDITFYNIEEGYNQWPTNSHPKDTTHDSSMREYYYHYSSTCVKPFVTLTGSMAEARLFLTGYAVEKAAGKLPGLLAHAQQAVVRADDAVLRRYLVELVHELENMTTAFQTSSDPRPLSDCFMDHVEWARAIDVSANPILPGEKTGSGLLFPSFHMLDVFFSRSSYKSVMGKLAKRDRDWLPKLHQDFFRALAQVSVFQYIRKNRHGNGPELMCIFRRALAALSADQGFLGKHHLRTASYLELMFKVGRPFSSNGSGTSFPWQTKIWANITERLKKGMTERIGPFQDWYHDATVIGVYPAEGLEDTFRVVMDTKGALVYESGDHIALISENSSETVSQALEVLHLQPDTMLAVTSEKWKRVLANRQQDLEYIDSTGPVHIRADFLLRNASMNMDGNLGDRLAENMFVVNPIIRVLLKTQCFGSIVNVLNMVRELGPVSTSHLRAYLDQILVPLTPRFYSVTSHMKSSPSIVEFMVSKVRYETTLKLPCEVWEERKTLKTNNTLHHGGVSVTAAEQHLRRYTVINRQTKDEPNAADTSILLSQQRTQAVKDIAKHFCEDLRIGGAEKSSNFPWTASFKAQAILYNLSRSTKDFSYSLEGVSSSFLSRLRPGSSVSVRIVPELGFRLPSDSGAPVIMIALGNGIAPFISFLKELMCQNRREDRQREAWLILGVKARRNIQYADELKEAVCKQKIINFSVAFSQEDCDLDVKQSVNEFAFRSGSRKRIPRLFEENPELYIRLWELLCQKAHVYACGRPELQLVVRDLITKSLRWVKDKSLSQSAAIRQEESPEEYVYRMIANRRLHFDCYYSGKPEDSGIEFSISEVAEHRSLKSCWVILQNHVYDITSFLQAHPGGPKILLDKAGRDLTEDFSIVHGLDNLKIKSFLSPYKIGRLKMFTDSCRTLQSMMDGWSVTLLHGLLERRSVFLMDWNEFPELNEPESFRRWKSQHSSEIGITNMCRRFWAVHEPDLFGFLEGALGDTRCGKMLQTVLLRNGEFVGTGVLLEEIRDVRERAITNSDVESGNRLAGDPNSYMLSCAVFVDEYVKMGIRIQKQVEMATEVCYRKDCLADVRTVLLSEIFRSLLNGTKNIYNCLPRTIFE